jgi:hypothetical protein
MVSSCWREVLRGGNQDAVNQPGFSGIEPHVLLKEVPVTGFGQSDRVKGTGEDARNQGICLISGVHFVEKDLCPGGAAANLKGGGIVT